MAKNRRRRPTPQSVTPRPLTDGENVRSIIRDELSKALALPPGAQTTSYSTEYLQALTQRQQFSGAMNPLPRDPNVTAPFGPGLPLLSAPISPLLPSGRPAPRQWEYPVSWNLQTTTTRLVPWSVLRDVSDQVSVVRSCIDTCKATITSLDWSFSIDSRRARALAKRSGTSNHEVIVDLQDKFADDIERLHQWWMRPNRGWTFTEWLSAVLEDELVCDAVALYPRMSLGGKLIAVEHVDASCYSDDTEVLTKRGWLKFSDVDISTDEFATRNQKTKAFEWQQATYYHQAPFAGELYHFGVKSVDLLVTPNHRMLVSALPRPLGGQWTRGRGDVIVTADDLAKHGNGQASRIPMTSVWEAPDLERFHLDSTGRTCSKPFTCSGDDFAAFMGMYLSEGSIGKGYRVQIAQRTKSKGYGPYHSLLSRIFDGAVHDHKDGFEVSRTCLHDYLVQFGKSYEKHVPQIVKEMSARQLEIFWQYYMFGDGTTEQSVRQNGDVVDRQRIVTTSKRMADDLQEIAQKMGLSATVTSFVVTEDCPISDRNGTRTIKASNKRRRYTVNLSTTQDRRWNVSKVPYVGDVFCVSVPNEILFVRRNGKAAWCGNTIKPLLDERGSTPVPPLAAFQQILFGYPRGEYSASPADDIDGEYADAVYGPIDFQGARTDTLIYKVRNRRTQGPYGFSPVEASLPAVDLWLKRWDWLRSEYSAGVTPEMIVKVAGNMTPEQLRQYESVFNDDLSGRSDERHRARFLPDGFEPSYPDNAGNKFASDLDLHIIRLICAAFGVLPTSLGFTPNRGVGSMGAQGHAQGERDAQLERSTKPRASWVVDLINEISVNYLGMPPEVTFAFHGLDDEDEQRKATLLEGYVNHGLMVLNEGRDHLNLPRFGIEQANEPFIATPTGPAFFNPAVVPVGMPGNLPSAPQNGQPQAVEAPATPAIEAASDAPRDEQVQDAEGAKAERKAFTKFAENRTDRGWRDFVFKHHTRDVAEAANRLAEDGDLDAVKALFSLSAR